MSITTKSAMLRIVSLLFAIIVIATALPASAAVFGEGYGIDIKTEHITDDELVRLAALGIKRVRIGIVWRLAEDNDGNFDWNRPLARAREADDHATRPVYTYDEIIATMHKLGLRVDVILQPFAEGYRDADRAPRTDDEMAAFNAFAAATARHYSTLYGAKAFTWMIGNEPDMDGGYPPEANGTIYGQLLAGSCAAIKAVVPQARVTGPALSAYGDGLLRYDFIRAMFDKANPLRCIDMFTVHPYRVWVPESAVEDYERLRIFLQPWQPSPPVPVAVDEWGYSISRSARPPSGAAWRDFSATEQAALLLRSYLVNLAAGIPLTVVYEWRDSGSDAYEYEDNFGITDVHGQDKPAARMIRAVWSTLAGRALEQALTPEGCSPDIHILVFGPRRSAGRRVVVVWQEKQPSVPVQMKLEGTPSVVQDMFGHDIPVTKEGGMHMIQLTTEPRLVTMPSDAVLRLACME